MVRRRYIDLKKCEVYLASGRGDEELIPLSNEALVLILSSAISRHT